MYSVAVRTGSNIDNGECKISIHLGLSLRDRGTEGQKDTEGFWSAAFSFADLLCTEQYMIRYISLFVSHKCY